MKTRNLSQGFQTWIGLLSGIIFLMISGPAGAAITGSKHDFSNTNTTSAYGTDEICVFCHAPHNAPGASNGPLWNRAYSATGFTMYSTTVAGSDINGTLDADVSGVSALCMSCHDGTTALDAFGGGAGTTLIGAVNANADFGKNLADDHPVNISYTDTTATADGELYTPSTTTVAALGGATIQAGMLSSDQVVCASCHDVHNTAAVAGTKLLRIDNRTQSALCLTCHQK